MRTAAVVGEMAWRRAWALLARAAESHPRWTIRAVRALVVHKRHASLPPHPVMGTLYNYDDERALLVALADPLAAVGIRRGPSVQAQIEAALDRLAPLFVAAVRGAQGAA